LSRYLAASLMLSAVSCTSTVSDGVLLADFEQRRPNLEALIAMARSDGCFEVNSRSRIFIAPATLKLEPARQQEYRDLLSRARVLSFGGSDADGWFFVVSESAGARKGYSYQGQEPGLVVKSLNDSRAPLAFRPISEPWYLYVRRR
jgi:hypothetical protein